MKILELDPSSNSKQAVISNDKILHINIYSIIIISKNALTLDVFDDGLEVNDDTTDEYELLSIGARPTTSGTWSANNKI